MQITRKNILKAGLWILGAILIGAVGSGVWEGLLGPAVRAARNWILDSVSLVFLGFKNGIYVEIARDHYSAVNVASLFLLMAIFVGMCAAAILHLAASLWETQRRYEHVARRVEEALHGKPQQQRTPAQVDTDIKVLGTAMKRSWRYLYALGGFTALLLTSNIISFATLSYVDSALAHYHQVLRIASPYLNPDEKLTIESQFAQIHNKQGYAEVVNRLAAIAKAHGQSLPNFDPW